MVAGAARCTTSEREPARRPRRSAVWKSAGEVSLEVRLSTAPARKGWRTQRLRRRGACGPCRDGPRGWSALRACASAVGNRASSHDDGCSAGTYACSRRSPGVWWHWLLGDRGVRLACARAPCARSARAGGSGRPGQPLHGTRAPRSGSIWSVRDPTGARMRRGRHPRRRHAGRTRRRGSLPLGRDGPGLWRTPCRRAIDLVSVAPLTPRTTASTHPTPAPQHPWARLSSPASLASQTRAHPVDNSVGFVCVRT
jgi:hypothetical protein